MISYDIKKEYINLDEQKKYIICQAIHMVRTSRKFELEELDEVLDEIGCFKAQLILEAIKVLKLQGSGAYTVSDKYQEDFFDYIRAQSKLI